MILARRYKPSADEHGKWLVKLYTQMPCLIFVIHTHNHHMKSRHSDSLGWTKLLVLISETSQLSFKAMSICPQSADTMQSLPMQLPQPNPRRKKVHRDVHAVSRLPSFNSFCLPVSPSSNCFHLNISVNEPRPSLFRAEHVCGFGGTWGRYP
jgi:hypothetical protein